jgi:hypothetical protein
VPSFRLCEKLEETELVVVVVLPLPERAACTFAIVALSAPKEERSERIEVICELDRPEDEVVVVVVGAVVVVVTGVVVVVSTLPLLPLLLDDELEDDELEEEEFELDDIEPPLLPLGQAGVVRVLVGLYQTSPPASIDST